MRSSGLLVLCSMFLLLGESAMAWQTPQPAAAGGDLLTVETRAGARAMALGEYCTSLNRSQVRTFAAALSAWQQRNRWPVVKSYWASRPELQTLYTESVSAATASFGQHRMSTALACGLMAGVLRQEEWDPSVKHRTEIASLTEAPAAPANSGATVPAPATAEQGSSAAAAQQGQASEAAVSQTSAATDGQPLSAGVARFSVPAGWTVRKNTPELVLLTHPAVRGGGQTLMAITAVKAGADLRGTAFAAFRSQFPGTGLQFKYFNDAVTASGLPAVYGGDVGKLRTGGTGVIRAVAIQAGQQVETILMILPPSALEQIPRQKEMEAMVAGMTFPGVRGGRVWDLSRPPAGYGGLSGLWMGTRMQNQLNPLGGMDLLAIREYAVLFPDGRAYFALPPRGEVLSMRYAEACAAQPKSCGLYRVHDGQITLEHQGDYGTVTSRTVPLDRAGAGPSSFADGGATLVETHPVHGQRLSGSYSALSAMSGSMGGQSTSVASSTSIQFTPDGSFRKSGFAMASFSGSAAGGTVGNQRGVETGQYAIDGYTLTLRPASGAVETYTIVFETVSETPKAVFIDDRAFLREGSR